MKQQIFKGYPFSLLIDGDNAVAFENTNKRNRATLGTIDAHHDDAERVTLAELNPDFCVFCNGLPVTLPETDAQGDRAVQWLNEVNYTANFIRELLLAEDDETVQKICFGEACEIVCFNDFIADIFTGLTVADKLDNLKGAGDICRALDRAIMASDTNLKGSRPVYIAKLGNGCYIVAPTARAFRAELRRYWYQFSACDLLDAVADFNDHGGFFVASTQTAYLGALNLRYIPLNSAL